MLFGFGDPYQMLVDSGMSPETVKSMGIFPLSPAEKKQQEAFAAATSANLNLEVAKMGYDLQGSDPNGALKPKTYTAAEIKKLESDAKAKNDAVTKTMADNEAKQKAARETNYNTVRSELENQYNNLVQLDPNAAYRGRASDLPAIFNQQAAQLADAGVTSITNLKIQDGKLVDSSTGKTVSTSNLGGQVSVDRDTGVQKWGDIFSGVEGGANYGITQAEDGSVILFPAWEKSKSLMQQVVQSDLFKVGSLALAAYGLYNLGTTLASAGGAEALTAAGSAATSTAVPGSFQAVLPELGVQTAATTAGATAVPGSFAAALPSLITPVNVLGDTAQGLLNQDLEFVAADAEQLWKTTGDVGAVQQNLIAAGVDPIMAAEASNLAALGGTTQSISSALGQAFPGETVFTSEGLLSGGSTMDEFAKDIGGNITSSAATGIGIQDALRMARTGMQLFGGQQPQGLLSSGGGGGGQPAGVDASGLLNLLQGKAGVPGVSPLIAPVVTPVASPYEPLLGQQPQYQSLLGRTQQSLLG